MTKYRGVSGTFVYYFVKALSGDAWAARSDAASVLYFALESGVIDEDDCAKIFVNEHWLANRGAAELIQRPGMANRIISFRSEKASHARLIAKFPCLRYLLPE